LGRIYIDSPDTQKYLRLLVFTLALALLSIGCSGDDSADNGSTDRGSDNASTESDDGSGSGNGSTGSGAADLDDFPIPAPPVGDAALTTDAEDTRIYLITFSGSDFETVRDFYDDWTSSQSDDWQRTEAASGGVTWLATVGDRVRAIVASPATESDDTAFVTLSDSPGG
jgi:hypothetical protein